MENRSHALLAGLFTLVLLIAAAAVAFWLGRDRTTLLPYELLSSQSVSGLSPQAPVRYQGVPVGRVLTLSLDPNKPGQVRIRIGVNADTPITSSTWAELQARGVTGSSVVELHEEGSSRERLATSAESPATIPLRGGFFSRIEDRGDAILANVEAVTGQLKTMLSSANMQALQTTLQNVASVTESLRGTAQSLQPAAQRAEPLMAALTRATEQASAMARDVGELTRAARQALARLNANDGPMSMATRSMDELSWAAARLANDTLPRVSGMAENIGTAARGVTSTMQRLDNAPQSLIFGAPPARPGPGEPGFAGFGANTGAQ